MKAEDAFRGAIVAGGSNINLALGLVEAALRDNPSCRKSLMYKGSLLTQFGEDTLTSQKQATYQRFGVSLMQSALDAPAVDPSTETDIQYVYGTTLAMLPANLGHTENAHKALRALVERDTFCSLRDFECVRSLTLMACTAESLGQAAAAKRHFVEARTIHQDLAIETYDAWLNRG